MWPLEEIRGMTLRRSFSGRLCGYGAFVLRDRSVIDFIPYPEPLYLEICGLIYLPKDLGDD
jgi:hypothetical protein